MTSLLDKELDRGWVKTVECTVHPFLTPSNEVKVIKYYILIIIYVLYIQSTIDDSFSTMFKEYLKEMEQCQCPDKRLKLCKECSKYWHYIEHHLRDMKCPYKDCPLW